MKTAQQCELAESVNAEPAVRIFIRFHFCLIRSD